MSRRKKQIAGMEPNTTLAVDQNVQESGAQALARKLLQPTLKNAAAASAFTDRMMGNAIELPGIGDYADHIHSVSKDAADGDLTLASKILAAQAVTLDSMFAELARRAALNMGEYVTATERYGRLALKAQSNCRAALEALAKLHQPREQTVRHVHVNEGGQAVVADQFHHHAGGKQNARNDEQPHAPEDGAAGSGPEMLGHDAQGNGVPIPGDQGGEAVSHARRQRKRSA
jgi:hypothetical protein